MNTEKGGMADLTKGYVPAALVITFIVPTLIFLGIYFGKRENAADNLATSITNLSTQVTSLQTQVSQIQVIIAKPPTLPDNVAYRADLLRFCIENRSLKCPTF